MLKRLPDVVRLVRRLKKTSEFWVIGADVIDGVYFPPSAVSRFSLVATADRLGAKTRVLGFSSSDDAGPAAVEAIRRVAGTARLYVRDPGCRIAVWSNSASTRRPPQQTWSSPSPAYRQHRTGRASPRRKSALALINVSGLIQGATIRSQSLSRSCSTSASSGWAIGLVPHVVRSGRTTIWQPRGCCTMRSAPSQACGSWTRSHRSRRCSLW